MSKHLIEYISGLDGYKMSETHFKIGAKVHTSDFFYAKRLFQNSYYTARIALLLAIKIKDEIKIKTTPITLIGYELYSELLLSLVEKFLKEYGVKSINHFVATDTDSKIKFIPNYKELNTELKDRIIIIVPISSTGSTSDKIKEEIKTKKKDLTEEAFKSYTVIKAFDRNFPTTNNKGIIELQTTWKNPIKCPWCFNNEESRPIFETDKSSLIPTLIFDLPTAKEVSADSITTGFGDVNFDDAILYRKVKRNKEHFLYSSITSVLINNNNNNSNEKINEWLNSIKAKLEIKPSDHVVILSPNHYSNSEFINLVNDKLFNSSATVIHHQTNVDYLANFKLLNKQFLNQTDLKIYFVDDSLISGRSFFQIYELYRNATGYDLDKGLSGAIFLSNKSSQDINKRVGRTVTKKVNSKEIINLFSFVNINLPVSPKIFEKNPLEYEAFRYKNVYKKVLHDAIQKHFLDKSKDISGENIEPHIRGKSDKTDKHLKMFKATHKIYEYFNNNRDFKKITFDDLLNKIGFSKGKEDKMIVLKVLSQYPFYLYKPVRELSFKWHKNWLNKAIIDQTKALNNNTYEYSNFRELKFLIRRGVFLSNYHILSDVFLKLIDEVFIAIDKYDSGKDEEQIKDVQAKLNLDTSNFRDILSDNIKEKSLKQFHIYLINNYTELFEKNGWCAAKLNENIDNLPPNHLSTSQAKQFIRMIKIEAGCALNDFYEILRVEKQYWVLKDIKDKKVIEIENDNILKFLLSPENEKDLSSNKFELANTVLSLKKGDVFKPQFINFLWVKQFLYTDTLAKKSKVKIENSLTEKTEALFSKFKLFFESHCEVGAFFVVKDGRGGSHLVYDKDKLGMNFISELDEEKHKLIFDFMEGENASYSEDETDDHDVVKPKKSIIEYELIGEKWIDLYGTYPKKAEAEIKFISGCEWVLMIRISDSAFKTLGLMGFYGNSNLKNDPLAKQLLMLLRKDLGKFIKEHHQNDEFAALREAELVKRFAYLAGHGRQMMQKLAAVDRQQIIFRPIVDTMEKLQYMFATKWIAVDGNTKKTKIGSIEKLFESLFLFGGVINDQVISQIKDIGESVYASEYIDNSVELDINLKSLSEGSSFCFNPEVLKFICFELFINAKKNRFHIIENSDLQCENFLKVDFQIVSGKLVMKMIGSGTKVPPAIKDKINSGHNVKPHNEISGLNLVQKVIDILSKSEKINELRMDSEKTCNCNLYTNTVTLILNPMNKD